MNDNQPPIRHVIVTACPSPLEFGTRIVDTYGEVVLDAGQDVDLRDLCANRFDPVLRSEELRARGEGAPAADVAAEREAIRDAAILVLVFPLWLGLPPAILKGYLDRVLGFDMPDTRLAQAAGHPLLARKPLLSFGTSTVRLAWLDERDQLLSLQTILDVYLLRGFGMSRSEHVTFDAVTTDLPSDHAKRHLDRVREVARHTCALLSGDLPPAPFEA